MISPTNPDFSEMKGSQNDRKGKNAEQMLHDANDAKELSDDLARTKDLCYDYNRLCPSDRFEEGKQKLMKKLLVEVKGAL